MEIEKISNNQIKFTLTEADLRKRDVRLHELSYSSAKTQELFREIMERAAIECGFYTDHQTPLIIEASPISHDSIMIIVTKVASHDEIEERFGYPPIFEGLKNVSRGDSQRKKPGTSKSTRVQTAIDKAKAQKAAASQHKLVIYEFDSLDDVQGVCARLKGAYIGANMLYKYNDKFYLIIDTIRIKLCEISEGILKEHGHKFSNSGISKAFLQEYGELMVKSKAIEVIANILG